MEVAIEDIENIENNLFLNNINMNTICVIPDNYSVTTNPDEYLYSSSLETFIKLAKQNNLPLTVLGKDGDYELIENRAIEWFAPVLFISSLYFSQNPDLVSLALNMLANYLTKIFKTKSDTNINLKIILKDEDSRRIKKIKYKGPAKGLVELNKIIDTTFKEIK